jgi:signal recognition particle receptor subunit alpha
VVLVDTAGRMQNNAPLMAALTKLVQTVPMDSILLVAEALVGHDALSQYEMFHRAVRRVDGLILTKYDTVGTKVGAALTLTHETSTPIVFLGTGQKYHHLQSLNVNSVIASLFAS